MRYSAGGPNPSAAYRIKIVSAAAGHPLPVDGPARVDTCPLTCYRASRSFTNAHTDGYAVYPAVACNREDVRYFRHASDRLAITTDSAVQLCQISDVPNVLYLVREVST